MGISGLWSALARVRERAWALGAAPAGPLILDMDATLVPAHSDKQGATPTYKQGYGFHPLGCWLDRGDGTGEALAMILRPGNAASNTAADHVKVLAMALLALPQASPRAADPGPRRLRWRHQRLRRRTRPPQPPVLGEEDEITYPSERDYLVLARVLLARSEPARALRLLERLDAPPSPRAGRET